MRVSERESCSLGPGGAIESTFIWATGLLQPLKMKLPCRSHMASSLNWGSLLGSILQDAVRYRDPKREPNRGLSLKGNVRVTRVSTDSIKTVFKMYQNTTGVLTFCCLVLSVSCVSVSEIHCVNPEPHPLVCCTRRQKRCKYRCSGVLAKGRDACDSFSCSTSLRSMLYNEAKTR